MVKQVLDAAGFIDGSTYTETMFVSPPPGTYCIYLDTYTRRGSDDLNLIRDHTYTIELYSPYPNPEAETRIEAALDARGIDFEKDPLYWLQEEQLYQVVYTFDFTEK